MMRFWMRPQMRWTIGKIGLLLLPLSVFSGCGRLEISNQIFEIADPSFFGSMCEERHGRCSIEKPGRYADEPETTTFWDGLHSKTYLASVRLTPCSDRDLQCSYAYEAWIRIQSISVSHYFPVHDARVIRWDQKTDSGILLGSGPPRGPEARIRYVAVIERGDLKGFHIWRLSRRAYGRPTWVGGTGVGRTQWVPVR